MRGKHGKDLMVLLPVPQCGKPERRKYPAFARIGEHSVARHARRIPRVPLREKCLALVKRRALVVPVVGSPIREHVGLLGERNPEERTRVRTVELVAADSRPGVERILRNVESDLLAARVQVFRHRTLPCVDARPEPIARVEELPLLAVREIEIHLRARLERHAGKIALQPAPYRIHDRVEFRPPLVEAGHRGVPLDSGRLQSVPQRGKRVFHVFVELRLCKLLGRSPAHPDRVRVLRPRHKIHQAIRVRPARTGVEDILELRRREAGFVERVEPVVEHRVLHRPAHALPSRTIDLAQKAVHRRYQRDEPEPFRQGMFPHDDAHGYLLQNRLAVDDAHFGGVLAGRTFRRRLRLDPKTLRAAGRHIERRGGKERIRQPAFVRWRGVRLVAKHLRTLHIPLPLPRKRTGEILSVRRTRRVAFEAQARAPRRSPARDENLGVFRLSAHQVERQRPRTLAAHRKRERSHAAERVGRPHDGGVRSKRHVHADRGRHLLGLPAPHPARARRLRAFVMDFVGGLEGKQRASLDVEALACFGHSPLDPAVAEQRRAESVGAAGVQDDAPDRLRRQEHAARLDPAVRAIREVSLEAPFK